MRSCVCLKTNEKLRQTSRSCKKKKQKKKPSLPIQQTTLFTREKKTALKTRTIRAQCVSSSSSSYMREDKVSKAFLLYFFLSQHQGDISKTIFCRARPSACSRVRSCVRKFFAKTSMFTAKTERRGSVPSALLMLLLIFVNGTITPSRAPALPPPPRH